jgi:hypothetical protein
MNAFAGQVVFESVLFQQSFPTLSFDQPGGYVTGFLLCRSTPAYLAAIMLTAVAVSITWIDADSISVY